jgi:hypothetical protein
MRTIQATARVGLDHTLTVPVPADVPPGEHQVVVVIEDGAIAPRQTLILPVHKAGLAPPDLSLRREELYGDNGR